MLNKRLKYKGKESGMAYILEGSPLNIKIPLKIWNIQRMANVIEAEKGTVLGIVSGITPENGGEEIPLCLMPFGGNWCIL